MRISDLSSDVCSSDLLRYEDHHRRPARPADLVEADRPGIEERRFQVEDDEEDRDEVESHVELAARFLERGKAAFIFAELGWVGLMSPGQAAYQHRQEHECAGKQQGDPEKYPED